MEVDLGSPQERIKPAWVGIRRGRGNLIARRSRWNRGIACQGSNVSSTIGFVIFN